MEYFSSMRLEKELIIQDLVEQIHPIKEQSSYRKETSFFRKKKKAFISPSSLCAAIKRLLNTSRKKNQHLTTVFEKRGLVAYNTNTFTSFIRINSTQCDIKSCQLKPCMHWNNQCWLSGMAKSLLIMIGK